MTSSLITKRIRNLLRPSVFEEFNLVCSKAKSLNMAQGFPDWNPPSLLKNALEQTSHEAEDQYARSGGHLPLIKAISKEFSAKFNREIDPMNEVTVSNGATGVLSNIMCTLLDNDDEIIVFEPVFEFYYKQAQIFGANVKFLEMTPPKKGSTAWGYDFEKIEKTINEKTRIILLNTPHNPTGKVLTEEEIQNFIRIVKKWPNLIVVSDEVYENMAYNQKHLRIGSYPEMWDRTLSVYSLGKTFSCTGWRIGFAVGPSHIVKGLNSAQNWLNFCVSRPIQVAFAKAMEASAQPYEGSSSYYQHINKFFTNRRDKLDGILKKNSLDLRILTPDGGYFILADVQDAIKRVPKKYFYKEGTSNDDTLTKDWKALDNPDFPADSAFCRYMSYEWGVTPLPISAFYDNSSVKSVKDWRGTNFIRFVLCKMDPTMEKLDGLLNHKK